MNIIEEHNIIQAVLSFLRSAGVEQHCHLLVAVSGGADSTALAVVLRKLSGVYPFSLEAVHINHRIRSPEEAAYDLECIENITRNGNISLHKKNLDPGEVEEISKRSGCGIEAAARQLRYAFFDQIRKETGADYIATGHTSDDQIETVIMRVFQGSGPSGLSGIPEVRDCFIRPLIHCGKADIVRFLEKEGIPFATDSTNFDTSYLRNAVRRRLIPVIEEIFPGFRNSITQLQKKAVLADKIVAKIAKTEVGWEDTEGKLRINRDIIAFCPEEVRRKSLFTVIDQLITGHRIPYRFIESLSRNILSRRTDGIIERGYGIRFVLRGGTVIAEYDIVIPRKKGYVFTVNAEKGRILGESGFQIEKTLLSSYRGNNPWLSEEVIRYPLLLRSFRNGDRISFQKGTKEVSKLFQEWNVPEEKRWQIPVAEDRTGICAVFGSFFGYPDRFSVKQNENKKTSKRILVFAYNKDGEAL